MVSSGNINESSNLPENWAQLSPEEKREYRLNTYLNTQEKNFINSEAE